MMKNLDEVIKMEADLLIKNAAQLLTCKADNPKRKENLSDLGVIEDGAIAVRNGKIIYVGKSSNADIKAKSIIDAKGKVVMPGFVECHTHSVFAKSRESEFVQKIKGLHYDEILKSGGGILNSAKRTREATEDELYNHSKKFLDALMTYGVTTVEIKSGYGLNPEAEKKMLVVAEKLGKTLPIDVVTTYLGAHAVPKMDNISKEDYVKQVIDSLPDMKKHAEFCDVFCEDIAFSLDDTKQILEKAKSLGYKLKLHSEQMNALGGVELAVKLGAVSVDHLDYITDTGIEALANSKTIGVMLPGASFWISDPKKVVPWPPARKMIEKGVALALSTDFNPGSCPSYNLQLMLSLACNRMKMLPSEAINCATINAAYAIDRAGDIGSLEVGKKADILVMNASNYDCIPYWFGSNLVEKVIKNGKLIV